MAQVPSNLIPIRVSQLDDAPVASEDGLLLYVYNGNTYKIRAGDLLQVSGVPISRQVIAGTGLQGGGQLSSNVTLSIAPGGVGFAQLANTGVSAGIYGNNTNIPVVTVDEKGRVTAISTVPVVVSGYVPNTRQVIAGTGLIGGGSLNADVTVSANLSNTTPNSVDTSGSAGVSTQISRADHKHPAIDLSNDNQVDNVLGLSNGGTGKSLVAASGGVMYSGSDGLYLTPAGTSGQIFKSNGTGVPTWVNPNTIAAGSAETLLGGLTNQILYQSAPDSTGFVDAPVTTDTFLKWDGSGFVWSAVAGAGTVTSVNASGGTTGLTFSGGPITASGTLTLAGTLAVANGGTGATTAAGARSNLSVPSTSGSGATGTWGIDISGNAATVTNGLYSTGSYNDPVWLASLSTSKLSGTITNAQLANSAITVNGSSISLGGSATVTAVNPFALTIGSGLSGTSYNGSAAVTITNTAPDQVVSITGAGTTSVTGTYPNFTVTSNDQYAGTVTSVAALTLGTTGTDLSSTVANGTTTPVITLNVPTASAINRGALSSADWSTFNNKQAALVSGTNIKTVGGVSLLGSGDVGTIGSAYGGTGFSTYATGDIIYASATNTLSKRTAGTAGQVLQINGSGVPVWGGVQGGSF